MATPMDLNVPYISKDDILQKLVMAAKLGYGAVAINNIQPDLLDKQKKPNKKQGPIVQPPDSFILDEKLVKSKLKGAGRPPRQISRISTVLKDSQSQHFLSDDLVQRYDLIAVQPTDEKTFGTYLSSTSCLPEGFFVMSINPQACKDLSIDIITIDVTEPLSFRMKRPTVNAAIERGLYFEFVYSAAIRDDTMRKYFISNAQQVIFWSKGKNIILSSGCQKAFELRGPHDVANLGLLIDLKDNQAKDAVTRNCRAALCHSESRRAFKSVLKVDSGLSLPEEEAAWIVKKCSVNNETNVEHSDEPVCKKAKLEMQET